MHQKQPPEVFYKKGALKKVLECHLGLTPATLLKKRLWHRCFPVNFAKFLRTPCGTFPANIYMFKVNNRNTRNRKFTSFLRYYC